MVINGLYTIVSTIFKIIVNGAQTSSAFSDDLKKSLIKPLLKKVSLDRQSLKNYRSETLVSFLSKLIEKEACLRLTAHMKRHMLFEPLQNAYRAGYSTEYGPMKIADDIGKRVDGIEVVILALLDLFHTTDRIKLLTKLQTRIGVQSSSLTWFQS